MQALGADLISLSYLSYLSISSLLAYLGGISDNFCPSGNKKFEVASLRSEMLSEVRNAFRWLRAGHTVRAGLTLARGVGLSVHLIVLL